MKHYTIPLLNLTEKDAMFIANIGVVKRPVDSPHLCKKSLKRALILDKLNKQIPCVQIAKELGVSRDHCYYVAKLYNERGLYVALDLNNRKGVHAEITDVIKARIVELGKGQVKKHLEPNFAQIRRRLLSEGVGICRPTIAKIYRENAI